MPNNIATQQPTLPPHLQMFAGLDVPGMDTFEDDIGGGITEGGHPRLSIKGSKFRLVSIDNVEELIPALAVNVIIVGANPFVSKSYYAEAYDPNSEELKMPACYSDNGSGPSSRCGSPQSAVCVGCRHDAFGTKITERGAGGKACSDSKRLAVLPVEYVDANTGQVVKFPLDGPIYGLRIPATAMRDVKKLSDKAKKNGVKLATVVVKVSFDPDAEYPKPMFTPARYIEEPEVKAVVAALGKAEEIDLVTGRTDTARDPKTIALPAPGPATTPATPSPPPPADRPASSPAVQTQPGAKTTGPAMEMPERPGFLDRAAGSVSTEPAATKPVRRGRRAAEPAQQQNPPAEAQEPGTKSGVVLEPDAAGADYDDILSQLGIQ